MTSSYGEYDTFTGDGYGDEEAGVVGVEAEDILEEVAEDSYGPHKTINEKPVGVYVLGDNRHEAEATEFGATYTYVLTPTTTNVQVLRRNPRRRKAWLFVFGSAAAQVVTEGAIIGTATQTAQRAQPIGGPGGYIPIGQKMEIENQREWYAVPAAGNAGNVYITVLDETRNV
jgi:hypothetical protein